ncbi:MAG: hypothetical protein IJ758_04405 [Clostridia bacterium]|nr:hypothetical protein [Clostridia bacterium]
MNIGFTVKYIKGSADLQSEKYRVKDLKESHIKHSTKKGRTGLVKYRVKLTLKVLAFFLIISVVGTAISIAIFF